MKTAGIAGEGVTLKLKTSDFRTITRVRHLKNATQSAEEMFRTAELLLTREADGRAFRLIGIGAHDLVEAGQVLQGDLFGGVSPSDSKIDKAVDAVRGQIRRRCRRQGPWLRHEARSARALEDRLRRTNTSASSMSLASR